MIASGRQLLLAPANVGRLTLPPPGLMLLAAIGAALLVVVAYYRWSTPSDEHAYWLAARRLLAGDPLYDPSATPVTPYAFWYPPIVAQVLAPVAAVLPALWFTAAWTLLLLGCLWWLAGRDVLAALALIAFPPVAIELWFRNVHLVLAVLLVLGARHAGAWFPVGAGIKLAPGLGIAWLAASGRWKAALTASGFGLVLLGVSVALSPSAWSDWIELAVARGPADVASFVPVPFWLRAAAGVGLAVAAARIGGRWSPALLVIAVTLALPTLWMTALSTLVAIVPIARTKFAS